MSEENVERARRAYDAMSRNDLEAGLALLHPEGEFVPRLLGVEGGGTYRGHDGAREWWRNIFGAFPDFNATVLEIRAVGDATIGHIRFQGHGGESGAPFEDTIWQVMKWRDGKAIWIKSYRDRADALQAGGLPEWLRSSALDEKRTFPRDTALAMSEENVDLVRRSLQAIGRRDLDALFELYDPQIEFQPLTGTQVESGGYRGHAGVRKYFAEAAEVWDEVRPMIGEIKTIGDEVVVFGVCAIRGKASKVATTSPTAWVVTVREGVITRHRVYRTNEEALEAAGLPE